MSTVSQNEALDDRPFWKVMAVFDPDGNGHDFAYTIGFFDRGLPELHMYARPSLGDDPGADWKFSQDDCCRIMNEFGWMLVRGTLDIGSTLRREYDGGLAVVDYRVDPPADRLELEAFGVRPGALVLPVRWSLTRPAEGPAALLSEEAEQRARQKYDEMLVGVDPEMPLPRGWELPVEPSFEVGQRFGPMTPLVLARAAQILQADPGTLSDFVVMTSAVADAASVSWPVVRARGLGRPVGRTAALDAVQDALVRLAEDGPQDARLRRCWKQLVDGFVVDRPRDYPLVRRSEVKRIVLDRLFGGMLACLSGEVVSDVADLELRLWAAGPWQASASPDGQPGPEWHASEAVLERVRQILVGLGADVLLSVGAVHSGQLMAEKPGCVTGMRYSELQGRLTSWAVVGGACCPPPQAVIPDCNAGILIALRCAVGLPEDIEPLCGLNDWLRCLTSMLVHRARLSPEDVSRFARPVRRLVPGLEELLNRPV
jgi:hypothetical protein